MSSLEDLKINAYLIIGFVLFVFQFGIYLSSYDTLFSYGPWRTHHLFELPGFYFMGYGFSMFFEENKIWRGKEELLTLGLYFGNLYLSYILLGNVLASFLVTWRALNVGPQRLTVSPTPRK